MIGYMLQQALKNNLPQREVSVLLTQVEVDAADPAFTNPTKYIGPVYSEAPGKNAAGGERLGIQGRRQLFPPGGSLSTAETHR